jgi:hypothetical protein
MKKSWIYDIEIYNNLFLVKFKHEHETRTFKLSPWDDDSNALYEFCKNEVSELIGFNNVNFDYPILSYFLFTLRPLKLQKKEIVKRLNSKCKQIIDSKMGDNKHVIWNPTIPQIDLYKIHHFDNKARATSLKKLMFTLRMDNLQELPFSNWKFLTQEEISIVEAYNENDIVTTESLYNLSLQEIERRKKWSSMYDMNLLNYSDAKIGEELCLNLYCKQSKKKPADVKAMRTHRESMAIKDLIYPYISFTEEPFVKLLEYLNDKIIDSTKKVFSELEPKDIECLKGHYQEELVKKKQKNLNVVHKGFTFYIGTGGIHQSADPGIYVSTDKSVIIDLDVAGFHTNTIYINNLYPEHLGPEFPNIYYKNIVEPRNIEKTKENKDEDLMYGLKQAGVAVFGKSNSEYSFLYDPKFTMTITINNQLLILMLIEKLLTIPNMNILQSNTDGITVEFPRRFMEMFDVFCKHWENTTHFILEYKAFDKMIMKDVSNYMAVDTHGKIKRKGCFKYEFGTELKLYEDHSQIVVRKTLSKYFLDDFPGKQCMDYISYCIKKHNNMFDFFKLAVLKDKSHEFQLIDDEGNATKLQSIVRYYVSKKGHTLVKLMPPLKGKTEKRVTNIEANYKVTIINDASHVSPIEIKENLNHGYYVNECYKIIASIEGRELEIINKNDKKRRSIVDSTCESNTVDDQQQP